jgi:hypothetical protein
MHFRRRGNNVQLVKTMPGEGGGKAQSKPVGSANLTTGEIKTRGDAVLTAEETAEVKAWIARSAAIEAQKRELDYRMLPEALASMAGWIANADAKLLGEHAEEVKAGLFRVRKALDRALGTEPARKGGKKAAA